MAQQLTLAVPIPRSSIVSYVILSEAVDRAGGNVTLTVGRFDAQGNQIDTIQVPLDPASAAAYQSGTVATSYSLLQAVTKLAGSVSNAAQQAQAGLGT